MRHFINAILVFLLIGSSVHCTHANLQDETSFSSVEGNRVAASANDWLMDLPGDGAEFEADALIKVKRATARAGISDSERQEIASRIAKYLGFLLYNYEKIHAKDSGGAVARNKARRNLVSNATSRLFGGSTQFLICKDLNDFECLERPPVVEPSKLSRREDPALALGSPVQVKKGTVDDSVEFYFNENIMLPEDKVKFENSVATVLAEKILKEGKDAVYGAVYGMDDVTASDKRRSVGSMAVVYEAMMTRIEAGADVRAVFDQKGVSKGAKRPLLWTYIEPKVDAPV